MFDPVSFFALAFLGIYVMFGLLVLVSSYVSTPTPTPPPPPPPQRQPAPKFVSRGERACRNYLAMLFPQHVFRYNMRPQWLVNPRTGARMELDCYCEELKFAVEFNGRQHNEQVPDFHGRGEAGRKAFEDQQQRDVDKRRLCHEHPLDLCTVVGNDVEGQILEYVLDCPRLLHHAARARRAV